MKYFHPWILNDYRIFTLGTLKNHGTTIVHVWHDTFLVKDTQCILNTTLKYFLRGVCIQISTALQFSAVFIKGKILWHLKQNHSSILTCSTFWTTLTWAPVLLEILFFYLLLTWSCNNNPLLCGHGPETLWISVKYLWALVRIRSRSWLGGQPSHAAENKLMTQSQEEKPFLKETTCIALPSKAPDAKRCQQLFSECRRRSPGEEGDVWNPGPADCTDYILRRSYCCLKHSFTQCSNAFNLVTYFDCILTEI